MKAKVKYPIHWLAIVFIFITIFTTAISSFCIIMIFTEDKDIAKFEEKYDNEDDVKKSKAYTFIMATLSDINDSTPITEVNEIYWMYFCKSETNEYEKAYFKITYTSDDETKTAYYFTCYDIIEQLHPLLGTVTQSVITSKPIEENFYYLFINDWLQIENPEHAYWAREKSYNDFALKILKKDLQR